VTTVPSLFLSHGSPALALGRSPSLAFLSALGQALRDRFGRPRALVVASAHWATGAPRVGTSPAPETIHDFHGFPCALYRMRYPAPGDPALAERVVGLLHGAGLAAAGDDGHGLDHGVWSPLRLVLPEAEIPVVPLAVQPASGADHHLAVGAALRPLLDEGIMVVGSGAVTHNLMAARGRAEDAPPPDWVERFQDWLAARLEAGDRAALRDARCAGPCGRENHPTAEHLLPLYVAMGAAGEGAIARRIHRGHTHGALAMDAYAFLPAGAGAEDALAGLAAAVV